MTQEERDAFQHAKHLHTRKQYREALNHLDANISKDTNDSCVHYLEGQCWEGLGEYQMACEAYRGAYLSSLGW